MNRIQRWGMQAASKLLGVRSSGFSNSDGLFGTLGNSAFPIMNFMDFIPVDGNKGTLSLTQEGKNPTWLGLDNKQMQFWAYVFCSPLSSVIDRLAEADTNGILRFVDDEGIPINVNKNPRLFRIKKLINQPNPWQTWEEFEGEHVVLSKIFGYCPIFAVGGGIDKTLTKALINLNPILVEPVRNDTFDIFSDAPMIKSWQLRGMGKDYNIPVEDIILIKDGFVGKRDSLGIPLSKISGMDFFISNICAAMEADNVLLKKKGPLGIFSVDPGKDIAGSVPLDTKGVDELQKYLQQNYGLSWNKFQHYLAKVPVKWNPMSFNVRELMTKETIRQAIDGICDRFGYPAELMSGKNATYENRNSSEKWLYNNNVIPASQRRITKHNKFFSLEEVKLSKTFDHLPVLQEDIVRAGEAYNFSAQGLQVEWENGMITWNQWQKVQERDQIAGMDIYFPEYIKKFPQMAKQNGKTAPSKDTGTQK